MDRDLMGPAGFEPAGQEARHGIGPMFLLGMGARRLLGAIALQRLPECYGLAPALAHRHTVARPRIAVDPPIDPSVRPVWCAPSKCHSSWLVRRSTHVAIPESRLHP